MRDVYVGGRDASSLMFVTQKLRSVDASVQRVRKSRS